jgi:hypothetical protein
MERKRGITIATGEPGFSCACSQATYLNVGIFFNSHLQNEDDNACVEVKLTMC